MKKRRISWAITTHCNNVHPCEYCISQSNKYVKHPSLKDILLIADKINALGNWEIYINGGEPFSIPHFNDIIIPKLLKSDNEFFVTSNFSYNNDRYLDFVTIAQKQLQKLNLSYHYHLFPDYLQFANKVKNLISLGCPKENIIVSAVLHPNKLEQIKKLDIHLNEELGIYLYPQFIKIKNKDGSLSPYNYSDYQLNIISCFEKIKKQKSFPLNTSNMECWAGTDYLFVIPNGKSYRCQQYYHTKNDIGNIKCPNFKLLNQAAKCDFEYCSCGSAQEICIKNEM
ncbi:MAG: hypothetical protein FWG84_05520 [Bacteroidales bacterium]|nr:hypothetical protein [Bacteroidales bacterium]